LARDWYHEHTQSATHQAEENDTLDASRFFVGALALLVSSSKKTRLCPKCSTKLTFGSYNSSIFEVYAAQDYNVTLEKAGSEPSGSKWQNLTNKEWPQLYVTDHVPGLSDLQLIVDQVSFEIHVNQNWTYSLFTPANQTCDWRPASKQNKTFDLVVEFSTNQSNSIVPQVQSRLTASLEELARWPMEYPELVWPIVLENRTWTICPGTGWLQYHSAFHVLRARAKVNGLANRVQVAIPFLSIVIASNIVKVIGIYLTIKAYSVDQ
jgi:hypothetical protein